MPSSPSSIPSPPSPSLPYSLSLRRPLRVGAEGGGVGRSRQVISGRRLLGQVMSVRGALEADPDDPDRQILSITYARSSQMILTVDHVNSYKLRHASLTPSLVEINPSLLSVLCLHIIKFHLQTATCPRNIKSKIHFIRFRFCIRRTSILYAVAAAATSPSSKMCSVVFPS